MFKNIKNDSIENSEEYKKIKDELEKKINMKIEIDGYKKGIGYCHIYWEYKKEILKKDYGIEWKSPAELNPNIIFD